MQHQNITKEDKHIWSNTIQHIKLCLQEITILCMAKKFRVDRI